MPRAQLKSERLNVRVSLQEQQRLERLMTTMETASAAEVIRRALILQEQFCALRDAGAAVFVHHANGRQTELLIV